MSSDESQDSNIVRLRFSRPLSPEARALLLRGILAHSHSIIAEPNTPYSATPSPEIHPSRKIQPALSYDTEDEPVRSAHRPRKRARQEETNDITDSSHHDCYSLSDFVVSDTEISDSDFTTLGTENKAEGAGSRKPRSKYRNMDTSSSSKRKPWIKSDNTKRSLRREYRKDHFPSDVRKNELARRYKVDASQISTWFVNERARRGHNRHNGKHLGPRATSTGKNGNKPADVAVENPPLPHSAGVVPEQGLESPPVQHAEAGPSRSFAPKLEPARLIKTELKDSDLQIKTENGFEGVKIGQIGTIGEKIAKWESKRVEAHLEAHQAFEKVQKLHAEQTKLKTIITKAHQSIAEHKQKILEAERAILGAERSITEFIEEMKLAEAEHTSKKEKLDNIKETLDDLRSQ